MPVSSPRDEIDSWLEREVTPLMPPPGKLDQIRHRARRRKTTQAMLAVAGCAVVIGAAASVPTLTAGLSSHPTSATTGQVSAAPTSPPASPSGSASVPSSTSSSAEPIQTTQSHSTLSATTSGYQPPKNFQPTSVTFAGTGTGAVVGAVIGQAGTPGHCATRFCTSLAGTSDYGKSWYGVSAPLTGGPAANDGVSQLRFVDLKHGWAFGPGLWETSRGGWPWHRESTGGLSVTALEGVGSRAFAVFASCAASGAGYATSCTSFSLYTSTAGSTTWTPVDVPAPFQHMTSPAPSAATLVISGGTTAYLLTPSGAVLSGPVSGGAWTVAGQAMCKPGAAQAGGQPAGAQLAAGPSLVLACDNAGTSTIYTSSDGASWKLAGSVTATGAATSLASSVGGTVVLSTTTGIYYSGDMGATWNAATISKPAPHGFSYVGMTTRTQGVAVPSEAKLGEVFVTADGGKTWTPSPIAAS